MFEHLGKEKKRPVSGGDGGKSPGGRAKPSRSNAGPTPFHRAASYLPQDDKQRSKWLIYDNEGSFNGWFDWLPLWMRVGYWSPFVVLSLVLVYTAIIVFKPRPLEFEAAKVVGENYFMGMPKETTIDLAIFTWGLAVMAQTQITLGSMMAYPISFTGWSWMLITARAGLEFMAWVAATRNYTFLASKLGKFASAIRLVTITNACVVFTVWNFILLPIIYFKSIPPGEKRRNFLKFNFGFFMTNVHLLNLPLAYVNILNGNRTRLFTMSDLWVSYLVVVLYSIIMYFILDRIGFHFYPIFNPRTAYSLVSIVAVLCIYYFLFLKWNEHLMMLHRDDP